MCRDRRRLIRAAADLRYDFAAAHSSYFRSLPSVGSALHRFVIEELSISAASSSSSPPPPSPLPRPHPPLRRGKIQVRLLLLLPLPPPLLGRRVRPPGSVSAASAAACGGGVRLGFLEPVRCVRGDV
ncbi:hypothetical protein QJS04_geneDACA002357 [Acorus gramineus]|uniref:DUF630 domain-containing protein n=1 Tax=Acorus gramineus TaxID=55184 RepID=A0AAV9A864_ACOGR|nr:hypothetical protein QJS04_geneDACA002357 [Acorus gramineus]